MPEVTLLKPQKDGKRVNVYLDGVFGFGIDLDNLVISHIKIGTVLTDEEVEKIVRKAEFQKTLDKLLKFAMVRPRSEKEIRDWLKGKKASGPGGPLARGVHESMWKDLFEKLKHFELLDDAKFAKWWVDQRQIFRPKAKRILNQELRIKGIEQETINKTLEETPIDEEKMARDLLSKRAYKWEGLDARATKQKKFQYLAGKGFDYEIVNKILSSDDE